MISGINAKVFRPQPVIGARQRAAARSDWAMSRRLARVVGLIVCSSLFIVFAFSQLMQWQINSVNQTLNELRVVRGMFGSEHVSLLATRAQLSSRENIVELSGRKFQLFVPTEDQVNQLK